jgi:hypothetical protein
MGTGRKACSAVGSKWEQQEEGHFITKSHNSPISHLPNSPMLMLGRAGGVDTAPLWSCCRNFSPGYPHICTALVILEVFVLKNNWKDIELLSLCPEWEGEISFPTNDGSSSLALLKEPKALHAFLP